MDTLLLHKVFRILCFGEYLSRNTRIRTNNACFYCFYAYTRKIFCAGIFSLFFAPPLFFFLYSRASANSHRRIFIYVTPSLSLPLFSLNPPYSYFFLARTRAAAAAATLCLYFTYLQLSILSTFIFFGKIANSLKFVWGLPALSYIERETRRGEWAVKGKKRRRIVRGLKE